MRSTMPSACRAGRSTRPRRGSAARCATAFPKTFGERAKEAGGIFSRLLRRRIIWSGCGKCLGRADYLRGLAGSGLHLGVVSNKRGRFLRLEAERLGWTGHFGRLVGAADAARDKPAVEPVDLALAESGIPRGADVWFVGDTDIDMNCAVNAGCLPVLLRASPRRRGSSTPIPRRSICGIAPGWRRDYMPSGFCRPRIYR